MQHTGCEIQHTTYKIRESKSTRGCVYMHNDSAVLPACCFPGPTTQNTEICLSIYLFLNGIGIELGTETEIEQCGA
jgi:hypothetical protein